MTPDAPTMSADETIFKVLDDLSLTAFLWFYSCLALQLLYHLPPAPPAGRTIVPLLSYGSFQLPSRQAIIYRFDPLPLHLYVVN